MRALILSSVTAALVSSFGMAQAEGLMQTAMRAEFRALILQYLRAGDCDRRFGGFVRTKNAFLVRAKEVARELPEDVTEDVWSSTRLENFTNPPLPPQEHECISLRSSAASQK